MEENYYEDLARGYTARRDFLAAALEEADFSFHKPAGAYYIMTDIGHLGFADDEKCALALVEQAGIATVPGSAFYSNRELGRTKIRFCFPKKIETLTAAADRLRNYVGSSGK